MDNILENPIIPNIEQFIESFFDDSPDKRAHKPEPTDRTEKRPRIDTDSVSTPINSVSKLNAHSPSKVISLCGPAGNHDAPSPNRDSSDQPQESNYDTFKSEFWTSVLSSISRTDVDVEKYPDYDDSVSIGAFLTARFNIDTIFQNKRERVFKTEYLVAMVHSLVVVEPNILIILSDETGKITGIMYKEDIDIYRSELIPGCVMILVEATVYTPLGQEPYLIISKDNIRRIVQNFTMSHKQLCN